MTGVIVRVGSDHAWVAVEGHHRNLYAHVSQFDRQLDSSCIGRRLYYDHVQRSSDRDRAELIFCRLIEEDQCQTT